MRINQKSLKVKTETGQEKTLGKGQIFFKKLKPGENLLLLGLGPNVELWQQFAKNRKVFLVEHPEILAKISLPEHFLLLNPKDITDTLIQQANVWAYVPSLRYFPTFWSDILAKVYAPLDAASTRKIWLFMPKTSLLNLELILAARRLNMTAEIKQFAEPKDLQQALSQERPCLVISINGHILDPFGVFQAILEKAGVPLVLWLIDNPWHVLSKFKGNFIQKFYFFVTDEFFVPLLKQKGLKKTFYLPLATEPLIFREAKLREQWASEITFVGRLSFPNKKKYFAGAQPDKTILDQGKKLVEQGNRADYAWALKQAPHISHRNLGLTLDNLNTLYRKRVLKHISQNFYLKIIGGEEWKNVLPEVEVLPAVDYYTQLKHVYASSNYILNLTSFFLPFSLNQRHFDVWISNGFLLTDFTPGLKLFSSEAVSYVSFTNYTKLMAKIKRLEQDNTLKRDLQNYFKTEILQKHTYVQRLEFVIGNL
ncbi:MAG: DUF3880 domain-containing protein [Desulfonauticus sp.]|nr:DUF3880 domain-containing protein [Desulfonauticus sp.]